MKISVAPAVRTASTSWSFWLRGGAWALCLFCVIRGARLVQHNMDRFDETAGWFAIALAALFAATYRAEAAPWKTWSLAAAVEWIRARRWELAGFAAVVVAAIFMRLYDFAYYPPGSGLALEEAQTGGIAYRIIHEGLRPLEHPVSGYFAALGFLLAEESSTSLRMPFIVLGIASVLPFYLLMRELASAPAALFASALFAASRWLAYGAGTADELFTGIFFEVSLLYFVVRGVRTRGTWNFIVAGVLGGVLMYEYVSYHVLPPTLLGFLGLIALYGAWKARHNLRGYVTDGVRRFWEPALALTIAAGLTLAPLWFASERGELQFGYTSFSRDEKVREGQTLFGLLPKNWDKRVSYSIGTFTDGSEGGYMPLQRAEEALVDPVTATLLMVALAYGAVFFFRPWRLLFVIWFVGVAIFGAAVPLNFHSGRLTTVAPAIFVLIGMMVNDAGLVAGNFAERRRIPNAHLGWLALVPVVAFALYLNWDALYQGSAKDISVRQFYADRFFGACRYLDGRPDAYAYTYAQDGTTDPIFRPSDYSWMCHDVRGQPLPSFSELWTPARNAEPGSLLMFMGAQPDTEAVGSLLRLAYPDSAAEQAQVNGPGGRPLLWVYELDPQVLAASRGLVGAYYAGIEAAGEPLFSGVDRLEDGRFQGAVPDDETIGGPFSVKWEGLVYLPQPNALRLSAAGGDNTVIDLDGQRVVGPNAREEAVAALKPGWHTIRIITAFDEPGGAFDLAWVYAAGPLTVQPHDLFALSPLYGLRHRTYFRKTGEIIAGGDSPSEVALDSVGWPMTFTNSDAERFQADAAYQDSGLHYAGDLWEGYITTPESGLRLQLHARQAHAELLIDNVRVAVADSIDDDVERNDVDLSPGRHFVRLTVTARSASVAGARISADITGRPLLPLAMFEPD